MKGFLYKELLQHKNTLIFCACMPFLITATLFVFIPINVGVNDAGFRDGLTELFDSRILPLVPVFAFFITGLMQSSLYQLDESKKWGFFAAAQPDGIRRSIYAKYVVCFLISIITLFSATIADMLLIMLDHLIRGTAMEEILSLSGVLPVMVFFQLFFRAVDYPFTVRFGTTRGAKVKIGIIAGAVLIACIYLLFGDLPEQLGDWFLAAAEFYQKVVEGKATDTVYLILGIFMWLAMGAYLLSYRISCKLFLKGVEQFEK